MDRQSPAKSAAPTGARPTRSRPAPLPASGVYLAKLTRLDRRSRTQIVFTVRDDNRAPKRRSSSSCRPPPTQAYNTCGGKSLYFDARQGTTRSPAPAARSRSPSTGPSTAPAPTTTGSSGPTSTCSPGWSSRATTSPTPTTSPCTKPGRAARHTTSIVDLGPLRVLVAGGVQRLQGGARRRRQHRLLQRQHRLLEGPLRGRQPHPRLLQDGRRAAAPTAAARSAPTTGARTASKAPPTTRSASTASPAPPTTTRRTRPRPSATTARPDGDPNAPPGGRVGPDMPENQLFGRHVRRRQRRLRLPAHGPRRQRQRRIRRRPDLAQHRHLGELDDQHRHERVGWEWDAIPTQAQYLAQPASGVKRLSATNVQAANDNTWLQDEGRLRNTRRRRASRARSARSSTPRPAARWSSPPARWSGPTASPAKSTPGSAGDLQRPLRHGRPAGDAGRASRSTRAAPTRPPNAGFTVSPNPTKTDQAVTFNASASSDPDGTIAKYEWDLDGNGTYETNTGTNPTVTHTYTAEGEFDVRLRVTDNGGATDLAVRTIKSSTTSRRRASFTATPNPA